MLSLHIAQSLYVLNLKSHSVVSQHCFMSYPVQGLKGIFSDVSIHMTHTIIMLGNTELIYKIPSLYFIQRSTFSVPVI